MTENTNTNTWVNFVDKFFPQVAKNFPVPTDSSSENLEADPTTVTAIENAIKSAIKTATETATNIQKLPQSNPSTTVHSSQNIADQSKTSVATTQPLQKLTTESPLEDLITNPIALREEMPSESTSSKLNLDSETVATDSATEHQQSDTPTTVIPQLADTAHLSQISTITSSLDNSIEKAKETVAATNKTTDTAINIQEHPPQKIAKTLEKSVAAAQLLQKSTIKSSLERSIQSLLEKSIENAKALQEKMSSKSASQSTSSVAVPSEDHLENAKKWIQAYLAREKQSVIEEDKNTKNMREHIAKCFGTAIENAKNLIQHVNGDGTGTGTGTDDGDGDVDGNVPVIVDGDGKVDVTGDGTRTGDGDGDDTVDDKHQWSGEDVRFTHTRSTHGNPSTTSTGVFQIKSKNGNHTLEKIS